MYIYDKCDILSHKNLGKNVQSGVMLDMKRRWLIYREQRRK